MFFVSEEFLRRYEETGEITPSTLGEVAPLGQTPLPRRGGGRAPAQEQTGAARQQGK